MTEIANLTDEELAELEEAEGTPEWANVVAKITRARQEAYPPDWGEKVINGILCDKGLTVLTFSTKEALLNHLYPPGDEDG